MYQRLRLYAHRYLFIVAAAVLVIGASFRAPVGVLAVEVIAGGATITANACGGLKLIATDQGGNETTGTTNTFTAPSATPANCIMYVCNDGAADNIVLDDNALFSAGGNVTLTPEDCVLVANTGSIWYQLTALEAN